MMKIPLPLWLVFVLMLISMTSSIFLGIDLEKRFQDGINIWYGLGFLLSCTMTLFSIYAIFSSRILFSDSYVYRKTGERPAHGFRNVQIKFDEFGFSDDRTGQRIAWESIREIWVLRTDTFYMDMLTMLIHNHEPLPYKISESDEEFLGLYDKLVEHLPELKWSDLMKLSGKKGPDISVLLFEKGQDQTAL